MAKIVEIKHIDGRILFSGEYASVKDALLDAIKQKVDISGAYLRSASLCGANLQGAKLQGVDLRYADLGGAYLRGVDLSSVDLRDANIHHAAIDEPFCRMDFGGWSVCIRENKTIVGCILPQIHKNEDWLEWTPESEEIKKMDKDASKWWSIYGEAIKSAIRCIENQK